jgi:hypothetical protein
MARKRIRFRPPGLKPSTKVGSLGPYRGRLGLAWVIAPIVAGVVILVEAMRAFGLDVMETSVADILQGVALTANAANTGR